MNERGNLRRRYVDLQTGKIGTAQRLRRDAWERARVEELKEPVSPTDWNRWEAEELFAELQFSAGVDVIAEALARAELRGERRVRLDIEMERSSVRSEKP